MSSVYKLMNWLTIEQAVSYFNSMASQAITPQELLQISESGWIETYINTDRVICHDIEGSPFLGSLSGYHKLHNPGLFVDRINSSGLWNVTAEGKVGDETEVWVALFPLSESGGFWFKTEDICDLFRSLEESTKDESQSSVETTDDDLHPRRERTYQHIIAGLIALQYGYQEIEQPYVVADEVLNDFKLSNVKAPASRSTLGELFGQLQPVQKAQLD